MRGADVALCKHLPWILAAARFRPVEIASTIRVGTTDEFVIGGSAFALKTNMLHSNTKPITVTELFAQSGQDHFPVGGEESPRLQDQRKTQRQPSLMKGMQTPSRAGDQSSRTLADEANAIIELRNYRRSSSPPTRVSMVQGPNWVSFFVAFHRECVAS